MFIKQKIFLFCAVVFVSACSLSSCVFVPKNESVVPIISLSHLVPLPLDVARIIYEESSSSASFRSSPAFPVSLRGLLSDYGRQRFGAAGTEGSFLYEIEDLQIAKRQVGPADGWKKTFGVGVRTEYLISADIKLAYMSPDTSRTRGSRIKVRRTVSIPDGYSIARREKALMSACETLISELDPVVLKTLDDPLRLTVLSSPEVR